MFKTSPFVAFSLLALSPLAAQTTSMDVSKPTFTVFHEMGRIEEGSLDYTVPIEEAWVHRSGAWINFKAQRNERLSLDLVVGGVYYTPTKAQSDVNTRGRFFAPSVPRFDVTYLFGADVKDPFLKLNAGIFNYKYNEYSRNLGEYAFRSGTYPGWISTGGITLVGVSGAQVTGMKFNQTFGDFSHDLILNFETEVLPNYDVSLTYIGKYNWNNVLKVGGGVQFARLLPVKPSQTNPSMIRDPSSGTPSTTISNRYFEHNGVTYIDWSDYYRAIARHPAVTTEDSTQAELAIAILDSIRAGTIVPSYSHYDASGIKPLAFFSFDPKPLLGGVSFLGSNDLVLYGEAAILGVKDYPVLYDDMMQRIPMMVGFNFPTFKQLDVLSLEVEYYGSRYPDNFYTVMVEGAPWPTMPPSGYNEGEWKDDNLKWSVYAARKITDGVTLSAQVARDHARAWAFPTGKTYWGMINDDDDWYWMLKLTANL
jgi:hypothetical protein